MAETIGEMLDRILQRKTIFTMTKANIYADAENLPLKRQMFPKSESLSYSRTPPLLEKAIFEWYRVAREILEIEVPADPGFLNGEICAGLFSLNPLLLFKLSERRREHLRKFSCEAAVRQILKEGSDA